jgi:acyl dehydratase
VFPLLGRLDWTKIVHAEQSIELLEPVPPTGEAETIGRVAGVYDTGKHAMIVIEFTSRLDGRPEPSFHTRMSLLLRGGGGWGGEPGPRSEWTAPAREPDHVVADTVRPEQALLYRLSGDRNRLHSDPVFARRAGFDRPILHGLCTYGFAGRALLGTVCDGDSDRFASMNGRFSAPVFPGDQLRTEIWRVPGGASFQTAAGDRSLTLSHGTLSLRDEVTA